MSKKKREEPIVIKKNPYPQTYRMGQTIKKGETAKIESGRVWKSTYQLKPEDY